MKRTTKGVGVLGMVLLLLAVSLGNALAEQSDEFYQESQVAEKMLLDIAVLRPLGIIGTALGSVAYVVSYPFAAWGGNTHETYQRLVADPAQYTFQRPVGHFERDLADMENPIYSRP